MSRHVVIVGRMRILPNMDSRPTCCTYVGAWLRGRRDGVMAGANHARWRRNTGGKPLAGLSLTFLMQRGQAWRRGSETWSLPTPCYDPASQRSKVQKKLAFSISMCAGSGLGRRGSTAGLVCAFGSCRVQSMGLGVAMTISLAFMGGRAALFLGFLAFSGWSLSLKLQAAFVDSPG